MIASSPCPRCGGCSKLSDGLCPTCLLQQTLDTAEDPTDGILSPAELTELLAPAQGPGEMGRLGAYRVLGTLGRGGMGVVFRAEDPGLGRHVALKAMLPGLAQKGETRSRFLREARAAAAVRDDHVVNIYQVSEERGVPFVAMELLGGESLDARMRREPRLSIAEIVRIGQETALGLAAAHEQGVVHRDIKPGNLWLEAKNGRVKILDFGLARLTSDDSHVTQLGTIIGTPAYMAPEQARGDEPDPRCDLFSLGCVLYRLCAGVTPFKGKDPLAVVAALALDTPAPPCQCNPEVPSELSDYILQLLQKDPGQRPASATEVASALARMSPTADSVAASCQLAGSAHSRQAGSLSRRDGAGNDVTSAFASESLQPTGTPQRRRGFLIALALSAMAATVAGVVFFLQTPNGTIRVTVKDPKIQVTLGNGGLIVRGEGEKEITITPGDKWLHIARDGFEFDTRQFSLGRGDKLRFSVEWLDGKIVVHKDGVPFHEATKEGRPRYALEFDGVGNHVNLPSLTYDATGPVTLEGWVTPARANGAGHILVLNGETTLNIEQHSRGWNALRVCNRSLQRLTAQDAPSTAERRVHLALVWDGSIQRFFVDGKSDSKITTGGAHFNANTGATLGCLMHEGGALMNFFPGRIDHARVSKSVRYKEDFTPPQRFEPDTDTVALYRFDEGQGDVLKDSSGNGHHGKIVGATWVKADEPMPGVPSTNTPPEIKVAPIPPLIDGRGKTVKVFILAGDVTMEGKAPDYFYEHQARDPKTKHLFAHLRKDDQWIVRDDVFIKFRDRYGPLTISANAPPRDVPRTGVELEFGHWIGNHFDEPVILVKTADWHSLFKEFRPPSAGLNAAEVLQKEQALVKESNEKNKTDVPLPTLEDVKKQYGASYRLMLAEVQDVLDNHAALFPALKGCKKLEISGFVWFHGLVDRYSGDANEYASNLKHFIQDVRKDLGAPKLPFVIGVMGQNGSKPAVGADLTIQKAQLSMNDIPEFKGNVKAIRTDVLVDKAAEKLFPTWKQNSEEWRKVGGDYAIHYLGSAIWYNRIGKAMGEAMLELVRDKDGRPAAQVLGK